MQRIVLIGLLAFYLSPAIAKIPADYQPIIVEAPFSFTKREFDLTAAVERSRRENKPLYVYLGAEDCHPCKVYQKFLQENQQQLVESFAKILVVDIRTWLKGPPLFFKVAERSYSFEDFKLLVGDKNRTLTYPYYWLLSPTLVQVKQLPQGSSNYMSLDKQMMLLNLQ